MATRSLEQRLPETRLLDQTKNHCRVFALARVAVRSEQSAYARRREAGPHDRRTSDNSQQRIRIASWWHQMFYRLAELAPA